MKKGALSVLDGKSVHRNLRYGYMGENRPQILGALFGRFAVFGGPQPLPTPRNWRNHHFLGVGKAVWPPEAAETPKSGPNCL